MPDFIAVGPPRTGTTWLHRVLQGHVGLPDAIKETHFFGRNYDLGIEWYRAFFRDCSDNEPAGEIDPSYFELTTARERIASVIPRCRIICSLRDPVERAYSQWKVWHRTGLIEKPFDFPRQRAQLSAAHSYAFNVRAWQEKFGGEQVLVVLYDDLRAHPQSYLDSVCRFIGIASVDFQAAPPSTTAPVNRSEQAPRSLLLARSIRRLRVALIRRSRWRLARLLEADRPLWRLAFAGGAEYPPLAADVRSALRLEMRREVEELEELLGRDLSAWK